MKIEGKHKCEHCGNEFEWFYQVPQKYGSRLEVETMPKNKVGFYNVTETLEKEGYKLPFKATSYCPECDWLNSIEIEYEK